MRDVSALQVTCRLGKRDVREGNGVGELGRVRSAQRHLAVHDLNRVRGLERYANHLVGDGALSEQVVDHWLPSQKSSRAVQDRECTYRSGLFESCRAIEFQQ